MRPELKLVVVVGFMLLVVATPAPWFGVFAAYAALVVGTAASARIPLGFLGKRLVIELPLVVFALLMPVVATGDRVVVLPQLAGGVSLSVAGLWSAWSLLAKATVGVLASLTLAATTEPDEILRGLTRLRVPRLLVEIMGFMVRYLDVITDDLRRMTVAMRSRGCEPRSPRHWPALARSLGALFIRSYERGERVHLAMLSRGFDGALPDPDRAAR